MPNFFFPPKPSPKWEPATYLMPPISVLKPKLQAQATLQSPPFKKLQVLYLLRTLLSIHNTPRVHIYNMYVHSPLAPYVLCMYIHYSTVCMEPASRVVRGAVGQLRHPDFLHKGKKRKGENPITFNVVQFMYKYSAVQYIHRAA